MMASDTLLWYLFSDIPPLSHNMAPLLTFLPLASPLDACSSLFLSSYLFPLCIPLFFFRWTSSSSFSLTALVLSFQWALLMVSLMALLLGFLYLFLHGAALLLLEYFHIDINNNPGQQWVQAYGTQPAWTHTILMIENRNNKQKWAWRRHEQWSMIGPSAPNIIHGEAFEKVWKVLNTVHHMRRTNLDMCVPIVLWAYRTMCKTLHAQALLKLKYEAGDVIPMEHAKPSSCIAAPVDMIVREALNKGITQSWEKEHIRLEEEIR